MPPQPPAPPPWPLAGAGTGDPAARLPQWHGGQGHVPPAGVGVSPVQCLARGTGVGAMKGTHGALSASHPQQPHMYSLHPHKQPCSHSLHTRAVTHTPAHACTHTHTTPAQRADAPRPPNNLPTPLSDMGCCAPCPQCHTLRGGAGQWGAEEAGVTPSTATGSFMLPSCTPKANTHPGARRVLGGPGSHSASLPTFALVPSEAWPGGRGCPPGHSGGSGRGSVCYKEGHGRG